MIKVLSGLAVVASAGACKQGNATYVYAVSSHKLTAVEASGCVNTWDIGDDKYLVVSPFPPTTATSLNMTSSSKAVQWLIKSDAKCEASSKFLGATLAADMGVHELSSTFALVSFDPALVRAERADEAVLNCDRVDVAFRLAWTPSNPAKKPFRVTPKHIVGDAVKDAFVEGVGEPEGGYIDLLSKLSGALPLPTTGTPLATRYTYSNENVLANQWIAEYLVDEGTLDDVYLQEFRMPNGNVVNNVVGVKFGTELPQEIVVVGAHMDSTSPTAATSAPGAVDNGSGTVGVMMLAAATANMKFRRTIHFVAFNGEEQGLHGSAHYVDVAVRGQWKIACALTMDMIAYSNRYFGVIIEGTTDPAIQELMANVAANSRNYGADGFTVVTSNNSFGSDHVPFQRAGFAAILSIERDDTNYPGYHRVTDTVSYANEAQSLYIVKGLAGSLYDYAQA